MAFLSQDAFVGLLRRLVDHFPSGEIAFNGYTRFHMWVVKRYRGTASIADAVASPGFDDPRAPTRWEPRLRLVEEILLTRAPEVADFPRARRWATRMAAHSTALSRRVLGAALTRALRADAARRTRAPGRKARVTGPAGRGCTGAVDPSWSSRGVGPPIKTSLQEIH